MKAWWINWVALVVLFAADAAADDLALAAQTTIGMEGVCHVPFSGPPLEAAPLNEKAPLALRIARIEQHDGVPVYELRYIGVRGGQYDLRDYLRRIDGQPLTAMQPIPVQVVELLPDDHDGSLEAPHNLPRTRLGGYRLALLMLGAVWLLPLIVVALRTATLRRSRPRWTAATPLTLADQLVPLVAGALDGALTPQEQARLESLLIAFWRDRLGLYDCEPQEALRRLRQHDEAGHLLAQLEQWLYERPGKGDVDLNALLAPYRVAAPAEEAHP
jgi:hypothetical protein